ncbi:hypothetical protein G9A89_002871 [Geosiphon pyriformis]|nr:hypothetical protein G9A89_002871 [Geosiphon pyriformis]
MYPKSYKKAQYLHHGQELWISPKDCGCATSDNNGDNFNIYLCPGPKTTSGIKLKRRECNGRTEAASIEEAFASHIGPYLGQMMSQCPPMLFDDRLFMNFYSVFIGYSNVELQIAGERGYSNVELRVTSGCWLYLNVEFAHF